MLKIPSGDGVRRLDMDVRNEGLSAVNIGVGA
jgi:hypothetical protein